MTIFTVQIKDKTNPAREPVYQMSFKSEDAFNLFKNTLKKNLLPDQYELRTWETISGVV